MQQLPPSPSVRPRCSVLLRQQQSPEMVLNNLRLLAGLTGLYGRPPVFRLNLINGCSVSSTIATT